MDTLLEQEKEIEKAKIQNRLPKVFIPVHLGGSSCDMSEICNLSKKYGFSIIEDASHAIGGKYKNEPVGNCKYSSISVFSLSLWLQKFVQIILSLLFKFLLFS